MPVMNKVGNRVTWNHFFFVPNRKIHRHYGAANSSPDRLYALLLVVICQEDMISYGFSVRHWQMIEARRPSNLFTLLRTCEAFDLQPEQFVAGLFGKRQKE
jgi:hypothetical protein